MDATYKFFEHCWAIFLIFLAGKLFGFLDWSWWLVFSPLIAFLLIAIVAIVLAFAIVKKGEKKKAASQEEAEKEFLSKMTETLQKDRGISEEQAKMISHQFARAMKRNLGEK